MRKIYLFAESTAPDVVIGRRGENKITEVIFDFGAWADEFGEGDCFMLARRASDAGAYPTSLEIEGTRATWLVGALDTAITGVGSIEFQYHVGDQIVKSRVFSAAVLPDIGNDLPEPPDPVIPWIEQLLAAAAEIKERSAFQTGFVSMLSVAATKRVEGGTRILNQITAQKLCAGFGYAWDEAVSRLVLYVGFAHYGVGVSHKVFWLINKNDGEPFELTTETAPTVSPASMPEGDEAYKWRLSAAFTEASIIDFRAVAISYDANRNEVDRTYSAQYRYTLDNNAVTRTRFATTKGSPDEIIDVGLARVNTGVAVISLVRKNAIAGELLPIVSTVQPTSWLMVVPDEMFNSTTRALTMAVLSGDHTEYYGPLIEQAPASEGQENEP